MDFLSAIKSIAGEECIFCNEMMSDHTTFKVGGPAKYFVVPYRAEDIKKIYTGSRRIQNTILCYREWKQFTGIR